MVLLTNKFRKDHADAVLKARTEKFKYRKLDPGLYYVRRVEEGHGRYLVQVDETKTGVFATCRTIRGAACPSYGCCAHIAKVYEVMVEDGRRIIRRERSQAA